LALVDREVRRARSAWSSQPPQAAVHRTDLAVHAPDDAALLLAARSDPSRGEGETGSGWEWRRGGQDGEEVEWAERRSIVRDIT